MATLLGVVETKELSVCGGIPEDAARISKIDGEKLRPAVVGSAASEECALALGEC
jgi:hypothetical protein